MPSVLVVSGVNSKPPCTIAFAPSDRTRFHGGNTWNTAISDIPEGYVLVGLKFTQFSFFGDRFLASLISTSLDSS